MCGLHDNNDTGLVTYHDSDKIITIEPHITPTCLHHHPWQSGVEDNNQSRATEAKRLSCS